MAKRSEKAQKAQAKLEEFVVVAFADDLERAKCYETLLKTNDIPAMVREQNQSQQAGAKDVVVMVPEDFLDEAHVVIESQDAYEDFYDFALEDETDDDFDSDLFDDNL